MLTKCEKQNVYNGVFHIALFAFYVIFLAFRTILRQERHSREMLVGFYSLFFFAANEI